jgi:hypothetical protein
MEEQIARKCTKIFESCRLGCHVEVAKEFLNLALKRISNDSPYYIEIVDSWTLLQERVNL